MIYFKVWGLNRHHDKIYTHCVATKIRIVITEDGIIIMCCANRWWYQQRQSEDSWDYTHNHTSCYLKGNIIEAMYMYVSILPGGTEYFWSRSSNHCSNNHCCHDLFQPMQKLAMVTLVQTIQYSSPYNLRSTTEVNSHNYNVHSPHTSDHYHFTLQKKPIQTQPFSATKLIMTFLFSAGNVFLNTTEGKC